MAGFNRASGRQRASPGKGTTQRDGIITGYVLKLARESAGLTQVALADALELDTQTVQSWESGRRSLTATNVRDFVRLRLLLFNLQVSPSLIDAMDEAAAADYILSYILHADPEQVDPSSHPLAGWLLPRPVSNMLAWPLTGMQPSALSSTHSQPRRGPVPSAPILTKLEREQFFNHLRTTAELLSECPTAQHNHRALFTHQAYYRIGWDKSDESTRWLLTALRKHSRHDEAFHRWSDQWLAVRSLVLALSAHDEPEPLRRFIRNGHQSDQTEIANLNYWAYWVGEVPERQHSHEFMPSRQFSTLWNGGRLLRHLSTHLGVANNDIELNIHTLKTALMRPVTRHLIEYDRPLVQGLRDSIDKLLASPSINLSSQAHQELNQVFRLIDKPSFTIDKE